MNYALGYAFNIHDMFAGFDTSRLDLDSKTCEELIGNRHKEVIDKKIFKSALNMVLEDVIENNTTFVLPTRSRRAELKLSLIHI